MNRGRRVITAVAVAGGLAISQQPQARGFQLSQLSLLERSGNAVVRGTVIATESGLPLPRAHVRLKGERGEEVRAETDAAGKFEIKNLAADVYAVAAARADRVRIGYRVPRPPYIGPTVIVSDGAIIENIRLTLELGGVIAGTFTDERGAPIAGARVSALRPMVRYSGIILDRFQSFPDNHADITDDQGRFRIIGLSPDAYYVVATSPARVGSSVDRNPLTEPDLNPTYHPGTRDPGQATAVTVDAGQEHAVNISLSATRLASVKGTVHSEAGVPHANALVQLSNVTSHLPVARPTIHLRASTDSQGAFELVNVPPGQYDLHASRDDRDPANRRHVMMRIRVAAADVEDLTLMLTAGSSAAGRVVVDDGTALPLSPAPATVFLQPARPVGAPGIPPQSRVNADGSFAITGIFDWRYVRISFGLSTLSYCLEEVRLHGKVVTDTPVDFDSPTRVDGLEVHVGNNCSSVEGVVTHPDGRPAQQVSVLAYSRLPEHWMYQSRFVRHVNTDAEGRYRIQQLPGDVEYSVIAGAELGLYSEDHLVRPKLDALAASVPIAKGESKRQDLTAVQLRP